MSIVNFSIPPTLEKRVGQIIKEKGFSSRAEFFRFAAIQFIDVINKPITSEEERFDYLSNALQQEIIKQFRGKKLPSAEEQLADI